MKTKFELAALIIRPSSERGINFSRPCPVLVRKGNRELFQVPGHSGWSGRGQQRYYQTHYSLRGGNGIDGERIDFMGKVVHTGRLTKGALEKLKPKLEEFFGEQDFVHLISTRHTIVFKEDK